MPEEEKRVFAPRARLQDSGATEEGVSGLRETTLSEAEFVVATREQRAALDAEINRRKQDVEGAAGKKPEREEGGHSHVLDDGGYEELAGSDPGFSLGHR